MKDLRKDWRRRRLGEVKARFGE
jgi:hypothetical protein